MRPVDRTGMRYGRLVVLRRVNGKYHECLCDCGNTCIVNADHLGRDTNSCGCLRREKTLERVTKHGETKTRLHNLWCTIRERCNNPNGAEHSIYYERGITICDEWNDYLTFKKWALKNGYDPEAERGCTTIDRIDNDKGYSPENCRFVTLTENARNKRNTRKYEFRGKYLTVGEVSEITGISARLINERLRHNWNFESAATEPVHTKHRRKGA